MDIHKNARLTPLGRERMVTLVLSGQTPKAVGEAVGVCPRTVRKWVERFEAKGLAGLQDRSSRPQHLRQPTPQATVDRIETLRRQRLTGKAIAAETGVSPATVSASASSTSSPSPTRPGPTARLSASSRPPCASGPMPGPTTLPYNGLLSCLTGYIDTTGIGLMAVSAPCHPSALSV